TKTLNSSLGCQGWGLGASASGDRLLEVTSCGNATGQLTGMGGKGLTSSCGRQLTGIAFDGTYYYVAEGQFAAFNCVSRFTADSPYVIAVSNRWVYTLTGSTVHVYSKYTGYEVTTRTLSSALGCQGWGFGASASGDRLLYVQDCATGSAEPTGMGVKGLKSN